MNPKLVTIGVIAALAVLMVGTLTVGTHNVFADDHHKHQGDQFNVNNQDSDQTCRGKNVGCNQNNAENVNGDNIQVGNDNVFDNEFHH
jgi:hypothetical protein